jgi:hypothetical protein
MKTLSPTHTQETFADAGVTRGELSHEDHALLEDAARRSARVPFSAGAQGAVVYSHGAEVFERALARLTSRR